MWKDPIVEEVRKIRDAHAAQYDYDLKAIYQAVKQEEALGGRTFVKLPPKRIKVRKAEATEI
ncbi:MAG: hypothetical protein L7F78_08170 [Syntrophales bacterium LBB04]|nr:hypothetical protein [Syntrophales bacterium LBB04]